MLSSAIPTELKNTYMIPLSYLSNDELLLHKNNLTIKKKMNFMQDSKKVPPPMILFMMTSTHLHVPRFYGEKHFGPAKICHLQKGVDIDVTFNGELWNDPIKHNFNQAPVAAKVIQHTASTNSGGVLCLPTGSGKTQMAMYFIGTIKKKTLIVVHSQMLMTQWEERISRALPMASIGRIQGPVIDVEGRDIVMCMVHSLALKNYHSTIFEDFGFVICDETHILGADMFSRAIWKFSHVSLIIGLSATPNRKDGMDIVLYHTMGPMIHRASSATNTSRKVVVRIEYFNDGARKEVRQYNGKYNSSKMITLLTKDEIRNNYIKDKLKVLIQKGRSILFFSDRVDHLKLLTNWVQEQFPDQKSVHYHRKLDSKTRQDVDTGRYAFIAATYHLFSAGMDIHSVDTIFLATPRSDLDQTSGRIRNASGNHTPLIIDIVDTFGCFRNQLSARKRSYRKKEFTILGEIKKRRR